MKHWHYLIILIGFLIADWATKSWIFNNLELGQGWVVAEYLNIVRVHNLGAAFGFLSEQGGWQLFFLSGLAVVVSIVLFVMFVKTPLSNGILLLAFMLIISGALGNTLDRILYGFVIDFIDVHYQDHHWAAFNIADIAISCGGLLLIIDMIKNPEKSKK